VPNLGLLSCIQSNPNPSVAETIQAKQVPDHHVREAVNPRTGRRERVFVNLEAVYPDYRNPAKEISFEELRAMHRGWTNKDWRSHKAPFKQISGNVAGSKPQVENAIEQSLDHGLSEQFSQKLKVKDTGSQGTQRVIEDGLSESKAGKARKIKLREVKGETQTSKQLSWLP
jgi:checkpoint serine/threonine-protein kinase